MYRNLFIKGVTKLWPIYIGPQQQKEPDGSGDGCFLNWYDCPTQPRVTISDIKLINITSEDDSLTNIGVLRCNVTNPCTKPLFLPPIQHLK